MFWGQQNPPGADNFRYYGHSEEVVQGGHQPWHWPRGCASIYSGDRHAVARRNLGTHCPVVWKGPKVPQKSTYIVTLGSAFELNDGYSGSLAGISRESESRR